MPKAKQKTNIKSTIPKRKSASKVKTKHTTKTKPKHQTIGYLRVSTVDQNPEKNKADILRLANRKDLGRVKFVEEVISGKISWRKRKIANVIENCRKGDVIIVSELSRLGRSMLECMEILSIAVERGIQVYAVKGNWQLNGSIQSKIIAMAFSMASEICFKS